MSAMTLTKVYLFVEANSTGEIDVSFGLQKNMSRLASRFALLPIGSARSPDDQSLMVPPHLIPEDHGQTALRNIQGANS